MVPSWRAVLAAAFAVQFVGTVAQPAGAVGESVDGFPSWAERVHHQLANRARVDPQLEMTQCGAPCGEAACYDSAQPPLYYKRELNRAARFHASHMTLAGYFAHTSNCTLVSNIDQLFPAQCDGAASCSCEGGSPGCSPSCTSAGGRVGLFNTGYGGEIIASGGTPNSAFYLWLYEPTADPTCSFTMENGHRWLILTSGGAVGFGVDGRHVGDFGGGGEQHRIASGSHWPQQASTVEAWANWYDGAGPSSALINVDGECSPMLLSRGVETNGSYRADVTGVGSGCHRYFFLFRDDADQIVTFPENGSLGIGPSGSCPDWSDQRPATGASCACTPQCGANECGDDACGGSCGNCGPSESCQGGQCVGQGSGGSTTSSSGSGGSGAGSTSSSGSGGSGAGSTSSSGSGGSGAGSTSSSGSGGSANGALGDDEGSGLEGVCGCVLPGQPGPLRWGWLALAAGGLAIGRRLHRVRLRRVRAPRRRGR